MKNIHITNSDYLFGWTYDMNATLPKDTKMTCKWDNGSVHPVNAQFNLTTPLLAAPNQIYNIPHNFSLSGNHSLQCNMSNLVSMQTLDFNVSLTNFLSAA